LRPGKPGRLCYCGRDEKSVAPFHNIQEICEDCKSSSLASTNLGTKFPKGTAKRDFAAGALGFHGGGSEVPCSRISSAWSHSRRTGAGINRQTAHGKGTATEGSMTRPMMFLVPAILMSLATGLMTVRAGLAEPAVDECKIKPDSSAPAGSHWYYRVNRTDKRHCWYLGPEGMKVRSQAREGASHVSSPTPARENAPEMTRAMPAQMEPAQRTVAEAASTRVAVDFAAPSSEVPKTPDLTTREPATTTSYTEDHEPTVAQDEMPLIWPVLTEAERAGLADTVRESAPWSAFLLSVLALLFAGVIFKLARRHAQSYRRDQRQVDRARPRRQRSAYSGRMATRPDQVARRSALQPQRDDMIWQRPTSIDPVQAASLGVLMRDLQRTAA
jgi:hypothetical protein